MEKWSWDLKIHDLAQEVELKRKKCSDLKTEMRKSEGFSLRKRIWPADISKVQAFQVIICDIHVGNWGEKWLICIWDSGAAWTEYSAHWKPQPQSGKPLSQDNVLKSLGRTQKSMWCILLQCSKDNTLSHQMPKFFVISTEASLLPGDITILSEKAIL